MEYLKSVIPVIESNYVNFTTVERSIADFFIYNREQMDFSAKSVAGKLFVSEASLSRFAKKCGFRGYREFIYQYEENFVVRQDSMTGNTRTVLNAYQELLNKTYNLVNEKQIERVCRYMAKAGRVFVCGTGSSGLAAREMELRFMRIAPYIDPVFDNNILLTQTERLTMNNRPKDPKTARNKNVLVIGGSGSGKTRCFVKPSAPVRAV